MRASMAKALTSGPAGLVAPLTAVVLGAALAATWVEARNTEARLKAQVAALAIRAEQSDLRWAAKLSECRTASAAQAPATAGGAVTKVAENGDAVADKLATVGPQGFDVCARMEAADAAVLASLRAK